MLELNSTRKRVLFKFDGQELEFTEFSIEDAVHSSELISAGESGSNKESLVSLNDMFIARIMSSVKIAGTDERFWDGSIEDFKSKNYPKNVIDLMSEEVEKLNPLKLDTLETKKKSS